MLPPRIVLALLLLVPGFAHGQTWNINNNGSWQTAGNWNPAVVPNSSSAVAVLGNVITTDRVVTLNAPVTLDSLQFNVGGANGYTLTSSAAGNTLTTNSIFNGGFNSTAQTHIDLAANPNGNLIYGGGHPFDQLFVSNYSTLGTSLFFGPTTTLATQSGSGALVLNNYNHASNTIHIDGNIGAPGKGFSRLTIGDRFGDGGVVLRGDNTNMFSGATLPYVSVQYGADLHLVYNASNTNKLPPGTGINLTGGLHFNGNVAGTTQTIGDIGVTGRGVMHIQASAAGFNLNMDRIFIGDGGSFNIGTMPFAGAINTTQHFNQNGILFDDSTGIRGNVIVNSNTWAMKSGNTIAAFNAYATNTFGANANVDVTTNLSPAAFSVNTLRFNTANTTTLTLTGTNSLNAGGLLVTPAVGANTKLITGGTLSSSDNLNVLQYNTAAPLQIDSAISVTTPFTQLDKSGPGALILGGSTPNNALNHIHVWDGTLSLNKTAGVNALASSLNVHGGVVNIATNNLPTTSSIRLDGTGHINFQGPQSIFTFDAYEGSFSNANLTIAGALRLGGAGFTYNGTAYTLTGVSPLVHLLHSSERVMNSTNQVGAQPVFNLGGAVRDFWVDPGQVNFFGPHFGNGGVNLRNGVMNLHGVETYTGNTLLSRGQLYVHGSLASPVTMQPDGFDNTLGGTGTISQSVTMIGTGTKILSPGAYNAPYGESMLSPGVLTLASFDAGTSSGGNLYIDVLGTSVGTGYDRLVVTGTASLGSNLRLWVFDEGFTPDGGDSFLIMQRGSGSSGLLRGPSSLLNEGDIYSTSGEYGYRISYAAGDGNDISLTVVAVPEPTTWAMMVASAALAGYAFIWRRRKRQAALEADLFA